MSLEDLRARARRAMSGGAEDGLTTIRGRRRGDLFAAIGGSLRSILIATLLWSLVFLRASMGAPPLDPYAIVLRVLALGSTLRAFLALRETVRDLVSIAEAPNNGLVLADEGLVVFSGSSERAFSRSDVLAVRRGDSRSPPVLMLSPATAEAVIRLPTGLEDANHRISDALEDWIEPLGPPSEPPLPPTDRLAAELFDRAARGQPNANVVPLRRGLRWLMTGPYGALLVAMVLLERLATLPEGMSIGALGYAALALAVVLPIAWLLTELRRDRAARGLAAVLTPEELLVRSTGGLRRIPWRAVASVDMAPRRLWSTLGGVEHLHVVRLRRENGADVAISEDALAPDIHAIAALFELYRTGQSRRAHPSST